MDFGKQLSRLKVELRELYGKLSTSQKISIGLLSVLVAGGVVLAVALTRGESYVALGGEGDAKSLAAMKSLLDQNGIPNRVSGKGDRGALEVPRDHVAKAIWLAGESGLAGKDTNMDWLFGEGSFLDTQSRIDQRLLESRKRIVEDSIRWSRSVRDARIVVQRGPEPIYASRSPSADSAAVVVALRPGVEGLTRTEASTIRNLVSGAFNITPQNVQVTDDRLRRYQFDAAGVGLSEDEDRTRTAVQTTVENLLGRIYRPAEFVVGVLADLSARRTQLRTETYDPEKIATATLSSSRETESTTAAPGGPVGVEPNVAAGGIGVAAPAPSGSVQTRDRKDSKFENFPSKSVETTEVPAGELKGLSVNVVLDRAAVRRVLQAEEFTRFTPERSSAEKVANDGQIVNFTVDGKVGSNNLDQAIESHRRAQMEFLKEQLPMSGAKVNVSVVMFPRPEAPVEVASSGRALSWAASHWSDLLIGAVVCLGLFLIYRMFQSAVPPPLDVPPLDEIALAEESRAGDEEIRKLEAQIAAAAAGPAVREDRKGAIEEMAESVKLLNSQSRESPDLASAVIRMWLSDQEKR